MPDVSIPVITLGGAVANLTRAVDEGTEETGVTATESVSGLQRATKLTFSALNVEAIAGAANEAIGVLLYTLPAGAFLVRASYMNVALSNTDSTIAADTPEMGLGTTQGDGANATLGDVGAGAENIIEGQVASDVNGTYLTKGETERTLMIQADEDHGIYLNLADAWAGADTMVKATGTVILEWAALS
jgi:hypothetical protein